MQTRVVPQVRNGNATAMIGHTIATRRKWCIHHCAFARVSRRVQPGTLTSTKVTVDCVAALVAAVYILYNNVIDAALEPAV